MFTDMYVDVKYTEALIGFLKSWMREIVNFFETLETVETLPMKTTSQIVLTNVKKTGKTLFQSPIPL